MLWELMFANFHWKDFMLLECYILRLLVLKIFIILEDVGSITFCYTLFRTKHFVILWEILIL